MCAHFPHGWTEETERRRVSNAGGGSACLSVSREEDTHQPELALIIFEWYHTSPVVGTVAPTPRLSVGVNSARVITKGTYGLAENAGNQRDIGERLVGLLGPLTNQPEGLEGPVLSPGLGGLEREPNCTL